MALFIQFLIFGVACGLIFKTTDLFIRGTVDLAEALHLPKIFVGVTLVSLVTTAPEFIVSVTSSYLGDSGMSVGNALGSCICNTGLIFAIGIMLKDIAVKKIEFKTKFPFLIGALILLFPFMFNGTISRPEATLLLAVFVVFLILNYRLVLQERNHLEELVHPDTKKDLLKKGTLCFLIGGAGTVLLARYGMLNPGIAIAQAFHVPSIIIGLTLVAVGTSLPELFTAIISSQKGHGDIALGNVIGANLMNVLYILGTSALVRPLAIDRPTLIFSLPVALALTLLMFFLGLRRLRYNRRDGFILLGFYLLYVIVLISFLY